MTIEAQWFHDYDGDEVTPEAVSDLLAQGYAVRIVTTPDGLTLSDWDRGTGTRLEVDAYHARRRFAS